MLSAVRVLPRRALFHRSRCLFKDPNPFPANPKGGKAVQDEFPDFIQPMPRIVHPDWYRTPMPEDDTRMIGDYPDVPAESYQLRDPYGKYFDQQGRRNFGEPIPEDYEPLIMWSFDHETQFDAKWIFGAIGGLLGTFYVVYKVLSQIPSPIHQYAVPHSYIANLTVCRLRGSCRRSESTSRMVLSHPATLPAVPNKVATCTDNTQINVHYYVETKLFNTK